MSKDTKVVPILEPIKIASPFFKDKTFPEIKLIVNIVIIELDWVIKQMRMPVRNEENVEEVNLFKIFLINAWLLSSIVFPINAILYNNKQIKDKIMNNDFVYMVNYMLLKWFSC